MSHWNMSQLNMRAVEIIEEMLIWGCNKYETFGGD